MRTVSFIAAVLWLPIGFLWWLAPRLAGPLLQWARETKMPDSEQTFFQRAAEQVGLAAQAYYEFMQSAGPVVFIGAGAVSLVLGIAWWRLEPIWISKFGYKLKAVFANDINLEHKRPEPFAMENCYLFQGGSESEFFGRKSYYFQIKNQTDKTIDDVSARVIFAGIPGANYDLPLLTEDGQRNVSISPKSVRIFKIGDIYKIGRYLTMFERIDQPQRDKIAHHATSGILIRHLDLSSRREALLPFPRNNKTPIQIEITGRDVTPLYVIFAAVENKEPALFLVTQSQKDSSADKITKQARSYKFKPSFREGLRLKRIKTYEFLKMQWKRIKPNVAR